MTDSLGFIGAVCFQVSAISLMVDAIRNPTINIPWKTIGLIVLGAGTSMLHAHNIGDTAFLLNTGTTFICWAIVGGCKYVNENR